MVIMILAELQTLFVIGIWVLVVMAAIKTIQLCTGHYALDNSSAESATEETLKAEDTEEPYNSSSKQD